MSIPAILDTWDYFLMTAIVGLSALVGFYQVFTVKRTRNTKEFLVRGKDLGFVPIVLSAIATAISPSTLQGYPLEVYLYGIQFIFLSFGQLVGIVIFAHFFLPVYYNLQLSSIFKVLFAACIIYAPALALNQVTGLHLWGSVMSIGIICILYTSLGGIKAVIWSDAIQLIIISGAMCVVMIKACLDVGGITKIWNTALEGKRLNLYIHPNTPNIKETIWPYLIGGSVYGLSVATSSQMFNQRFLANPNLNKARCCLYMTAFCAKALTIVFAMIGLVMYVKYWDCDPYLNGVVSSRDQLVPLFAVESLSFIKGFPGIFVAGVLCATLSTLSSALNALSIITLNDYIKPLLPAMSDYAEMKISKLLVIIYGIASIAFVALAANMGGLVRAIFSLYGAVVGPLFGLFSLGMLFPWANCYGALSGFGASLLLGMWITIGSFLSKTHPPTAPISVRGCNSTVGVQANFTASNTTFNTAVTNILMIGWSNTTAPSSTVITNPSQSISVLYTLSPLWYITLTSLATIVLGLSVSIITGIQDPEKIDPNLISPVMEKLYRSFLEKAIHAEKTLTALETHDLRDFSGQEEVMETKRPLKLNRQTVM